MGFKNKENREGEHSSCEKKVLFVTGSLRRGGAERVISILANNLVKRGYFVEIATLLYSDVGYTFDDRIRIIDLSNSKRNQLVDSFRLARELRKLIRMDEINVVISFMVTINILTWISRIGLKAKFIPSERNDPKVGRKKILRLIQNLVYSTSSVTVVQTKRAMNRFPRFVRNNCVIISNPVSVVAKASDMKSKKIVTVGRLEKQKNQSLLLNAFKLVHKNFPEYSLELYGSGSLLDELTVEAEMLGIGEKVVFHGNCEDVHERIKDASLFVMSSNFEGQSNALLEAMMMGLPCVSTNCAGVDEAIDDGVSGLIVPVGDCNALYEAMYRVLSNPECLKSLGNNARLSAEQYKVDNIVDNWCELMRKTK